MAKAESKAYIKHILLDGTPAQQRALFAFKNDTPEEKVLFKFKAFVRTKYTRYFSGSPAPFHDEMILNYIRSYRGANFLNLAFRGSAKTTLLKLFIVYVILNDEDHFRKYIKILSRDLKNPKQIVTDVYNMILEARPLYGDVFEKEGEKKREETMASFTTIDGVKFTAGTVGQSQRGHVQDAYRPDWLIGDDIEDRESISSQVITQGVISRLDEAITGLAKGGSWCVLGNYIYEYGSIQWLMDKENVHTQLTPILIEKTPTWPIYTFDEVQAIKADAMDFWGEYMCDPTRSDDKFFNIDRIEADLQACRDPERESAGVKYWANYQPHHRFGLGADTSEGIGRDSNAMAVFDFHTGELAATYHNNTISPDLFTYEMARVGREYGNCIAAPEINNMSGGIVIATFKTLYDNIYRDIDKTRVKEIVAPRYGWHTNSRTKPQMFHDFRKDYNDGLIKIYDIEVLKEMKSYANADLAELSSVTRHFDLLTAVVIAWQMKQHSFITEEPDEERGTDDEYSPL